MLVVAALGGNALLQRGEPQTAQVQRDNVKVAARALADIVKAGHQLVITHGNGPQVGQLALQCAAFSPNDHHPMDVLGSQTAGMIGYLVEQELGNVLKNELPIATLLTQVVVDKEDTAFQNPTKFIGPVYSKEEAHEKAEKAGWQIAQDGDKWRRVVASPKPTEIPDLQVIKSLVEQNVVVICNGGGGIPVVRDGDNNLQGIEAVIDKDLSTAFLAKQLGADAMVLLTDVEAVYHGFGTPEAKPLHTLTVAESHAMNLPAGSMGPKINAACNFAESGGFSAIGRLSDALALLAGTAGTHIVKEHA
ncbi:carbamate kinase [Oceanisphaera pacifica]|uniref:Carbamate kinase n=1 Tax=Oceanisphaera pacifica TaxID=2818389 RepID=A0ABS3NG07_9GAMM|nr:carbamate kinase [Oceanisphaera pacifica]MBO1519521.1 carbamate kinase [Oceanisphaera pacifica]